MVTSIVGFGVVSMLQLLAAGTVCNSEGTELTTALNLAKNIREMSLGLAVADPTNPTHWGAETGETLATYDDIDDYSGQTFSPPIDARRNSLTPYGTWQQRVTVETVDPNRLTLVVPNGSQPSIKVTVTVSHNGKDITDVSWLMFDAVP
jgi:hypothetical protein